MHFKDFIYGLDPKVGTTLVVKPFWEIAKSSVNSLESKNIERGTNPVNFIKTLERRGNTTQVATIKFEPVQTTTCCSTVTMIGFDDGGRIITRVNFNLRNKQKQ